MYGQLRWFDYSNQTFFSNFFPFINGHELRYFSHFWSNSTDKLDEFKNLYKPNNIICSDPLPVQEIKKYFSNSINKISDNLPNQIYSLNKSYDLLDQYETENNIKFDLYIKMRTDLAFNDPISIDNFDDDSVYLCPSQRPISEYATDLLLFTKSKENLKTVCKMGFSFDAILNRLELKENRNLFYHEEVLANHLVYNNISIKTHNFSIGLARDHK